MPDREQILMEEFEIVKERFEFVVVNFGIQGQPIILKSRLEDLDELLHKIKLDILFMAKTNDLSSKIIIQMFEKDLGLEDLK